MFEVEQLSTPALLVVPAAASKSIHFYKSLACQKLSGTVENGAVAQKLLRSAINLVLQDGSSDTRTLYTA